jgi:formylglycine-generating enzyme required for sulfatase activity
MMENKVWVALFRKFAAAQPDQIKHKEWEAVETNHRNERFPVFGVAVEDAHRFAVWVGGRLPSRKQWGKAAGFLDETEVGGERGPFEPDWEPGQIAINREKEGPMEVGSAAKDRSRFGIRDMAGNGREWTREVSTNMDVPLADPDRKDLVLLRGRRFAEEKPLRFWDLKYDRDDSAYYIPRPKTEPEEDISFRVVLEIEF